MFERIRGRADSEVQQACIRLAIVNAIGLFFLIAYLLEFSLSVPPYYPAFVVLWVVTNLFTVGQFGLAASRAP